MKIGFSIKTFGSNPAQVKGRRLYLCTVAWLAVSVCWPLISLAKPAAPEAGKPTLSRPQFDRDIRPILAENCYPCHGPDANKRKAKLRLDRSENALEALPNGDLPIVAGDAAHSKVIERITAKDPDDRMPPVKSGKQLTPDQIESISRWIVGGATWQKHWSFVAPQRPSLPAVKNKRWVRNPIDSFILARLESEGLTPAPEAERDILLRRVSFDLSGLPPSPKQLRSWSHQSDPLSAAVDELLASPHYGERMASDWMDLARYADTHGYNNDVLRSMWRWRDWVIDAFNRNLPYDRFITEQLAGDLLPKPTLDQRIATGFNRNHGVNSEGGIIDEEYRVEYVVDRVQTTSMAWLGLTMQCARCHDHKFDPIAQKDFYRFFAFFNNIDETGEDGRFANAAPILSAPTKDQQKEVARQRAEMSQDEAAMQRWRTAQDWSAISFEEWSNAPMATHPAAGTNQILRLALGSLNSTPEQITNLAGGKAFKVKGTLATTNGPVDEPALVFDGQTDLRSDALPDVDCSKGWCFSVWVRRDSPGEAVIFSTANFSVPPSAEQFGEGFQVGLTESGSVDVRLAHRWPGYSIQLVTRETVAPGEWRHLLVRCDGSTAANGLRILLDGQECFREVIHDDLTTKIKISGAARLAGSDENGAKRFQGALGAVEVIGNPGTLEEIAASQRESSLRVAGQTAASERSPWQEGLLRGAWLEKQKADYALAATRWQTARASLLALERDAPSTMVMRELADQRPTFVLFRGQYDAPREQVEPDVPEFILPFAKNAPRTRLGLAMWLTDQANPLTARVVVNRFWQALFGTGIVKTSDNFGYQGEVPSHPELLDWLAIDFVEHGWDVKRLLRLIVTSATYRQDSRSNDELNERDPENRLLAHGPRQRLTGEMLRDQALFLSGLLYDQVGGPSVFPYQPTNLYKGIVVAADYPGTTYTESTGEGLYRRSLYTFWKRTVPHPTLTTFDVPSREVCTARRPKTNTPLQALAAMNDTFQVEAARKLAEGMLQSGFRSPAERLGNAFHLATARKADGQERKLLCSLLDRRLKFYRANPNAAKAFLSVGASKSDAALDPVELAAYANVASLILNLDETITRD